MSLVQSWIRGDIEWQRLSSRARSWAPVLAGALFGAGWWSWADAVVVTRTALDEKFPITYWLPGIVATIALVLLNLVPRDALADSSDYFSDEETETKIRCWLFFSYIVSFAAVAGGVAVLVTCVNKHQHLAIGIGSLVQCGLILASALLFWAFRTQEDSFTGYSAY